MPLLPRFRDWPLPQHDWRDWESQVEGEIRRDLLVRGPGETMDWRFRNTRLGKPGIAHG